METAIVLEQTKENVQPLRNGRRADHLGTVLQAQISNEAQLELDDQRRQYELAVLTYEGDDPLEPRFEFAHWIEQSYPSLGPESKRIDLLEDTINLYKDDERYKQDPRFVEILIKYINSQINPVELYQLAYNQGLGTMCAILYMAWAERLHSSGDLKRANQVYEIGLGCYAEPHDELKSRHEQFQLNVGRQMLVGGSLEKSPNKSVDPQLSRQALSKIHKSSVIGTRVAKGNAGILRSQPSLFGGTNRNVPVAVFQEDSEGGVASGAVKSHVDRFPKETITNKENALKAGPWSNKKTSKAKGIASYVIGRTNAVTTSSHPVSLTPGFQVHQDEDDGNRNQPYQTPIVPRALKTIRAEITPCPVTIFEHSDPNVKVMYPKTKIYVGGREFQLEELMAANYNKRINSNSSQDCSRTVFQTPMLFRQENLFPYTPSPMPKSIPVRLFSEETANEKQNDDDGSSAV